MSDQTKIEDLLREGIIASRSNDRAKARQLFEQVVELDENNEKGWFWLASVVESDEERRLYLGNVVTINPNNTRAQELLEKLEGSAMGYQDDSEDEFVASGKKSTAYAAIGLGITAIVALLVLSVILFAGGGDDEQTADVSPTPSDTPAPTDIPTNTLTPSATPTLTRTATFTPTNTQTPTLIPVGPSLPGQLAIQSGGRLFEIQPIFLYNFVDQIAVSLGRPDFEGEYLSFGRNNYFVFTQETSTGLLLSLSNRDGSDTFPLNQYWGNNPPVEVEEGRGDRADWSPISDTIAFTGQVPGDESGSTDIFLISVASAPQNDPTALRRLTFNAIQESNVVWHPSGEWLIHVANTPRSEIAESPAEIASKLPQDTPEGTDLWLFNLNTAERIPITRDGNTQIENHPSVSPDGQYVIYTVGNNNSSDIYIAPLSFGGDTSSDSVPDALPTVETTEEATPESTPMPTCTGVTEPTRVIDFAAVDTHPVWSPDGRYIAFSANTNPSRNADLFIYIYDCETNNILELVTLKDNGKYIVSDWIAR